MCVDHRDNGIPTGVNFETAIHVSLLLKFSLKIIVEFKKIDFLTEHLGSRLLFLPLTVILSSQSLGYFLTSKIVIAIPISQFVF